MIIAVAHDEAFNFIYRANIDWFRTRGEVISFSPLRDAELPECDFLYLPGGYPELFASELTSNVCMRQSIKAFAERGGRIFAECGGFMYLCHDIDGMEMCGVFPMSATMQDARLHLGYRETIETQKPLLCPPSKGEVMTLRGHEFHYSSIIENELPDTIRVEQSQLNAKGKPVTTPIYYYKNVVAGYTHWYWAEHGLSTCWRC